MMFLKYLPKYHFYLGMSALPPDAQRTRTIKTLINCYYCNLEHNEIDKPLRRLNLKSQRVLWNSINFDVRLEVIV